MDGRCRNLPCAIARDSPARARTCSKSFHHVWFVAEIAALLGVFIVTSLSTALLAFPDLHQKRRLAFAPVVAFTLFLGVMFFAWRADNPPSPLPVHSFECTLSIALMTLLPAAWAFYSLRKFASTHYRLAGSAALLSAFSVGALWLRLHEDTNSIAHLVEWHYLPMLFIGLGRPVAGESVVEMVIRRNCLNRQRFVPYVGSPPPKKPRAGKKTTFQMH